MGFEEFFENKNNQNRNFNNQKYQHDNEYSDHSQKSFQGHGEQINWSGYIEKIKNNKKLKLMVGIGGVLIIAIVICIIIFMLPLITKLFNYISQYGIQGLLDKVTGFLDTIMKGNAK